MDNVIAQGLNSSCLGFQTSNHGLFKSYDTHLSLVTLPEATWNIS